MTGTASRETVVRIAVAVAVVAMIAVGWGLLRSAWKEEHRLAGRLTELKELQNRHAALKARVDLIAARLGSGADGGKGMAGTVEALFDSLGIKDHIVAIKPGARDILSEGEQREKASVEVRELDLNAIVNLLFRIEHYPGVLFATDIRMKSDFENPRLLNLELELVLVRAPS